MMSEFPVLVTRSPDGLYSAALADIDDGPLGNGVDPYAAFDDLEQKAIPFLKELHNKGSLPAPSPADDRPVISLNMADDTQDSAPGKPLSNLLPIHKGKMLCYSWTNTVLLPVEIE